MKNLLTLSGTELASLIRSGEVTSREVVDAHIAHIEKVNPELNAVVADRFAKARAEANKADRTLKEKGPENVPPFHGVPCTIKESFSMRGMPNTSGLVARKGLKVTRDAPTVLRMRRAGAIPLGVTNTSELCLWMETNNRVYGRTNNPYRADRIVGGSSGGEGAIIGAGGSPFGLGADVGGSIRMPAFFNGVFGHKASPGIVPNTGQYPIAENEALRYLSSGPLARRAEDLMPLLRVMAGPDGEDPECKPCQLGDPAKVRLGDLNIIDVEGNGSIHVTSDLKEAQARALEALQKCGATAQEAKVHRLKYSFDIWSSMLNAAGGTSFCDMLGKSPTEAIKELVPWAMRRSPHTLPALILAMLEKLPALTPGRTRRFVEYGKALRNEVIDLIGPRGVMLYPSYPSPAPSHYRPLWPPFNWQYTGIFNVLELPVTQVPLGLNADGVPLGVQVVGIPGNDHVTIAVAMELERVFGGWVPPERLFGKETPALQVA